MNSPPIKSLVIPPAGHNISLLLAASLLAAMIPLWAGTRSSVCVAISTYGLTGAVVLVDRAVARIRSDIL